MSGRIWLGVLFLLFGLGFLLHQAKIIDLSQLFSNWWPLLLMMIGMVLLISRKHSSASSGLLFLLIGLLFLMNRWFDLNLKAYILPLLFIIIGIVIIFTRIKREKNIHIADDLDTFVLFSGADINSQSQTFQGGTVTTILGGAEIDLRDAQIIDGASIDLTTVLGGVELKVPDDVQVEIYGIPILGGWEDKTRVRRQTEEVPVLKVNCLTILGGVEIRN
ncbi:LiaF transmembrane domain-containing protein [Oceanobacillus alkalisoli]|uniref:LiaF transmembrane domain-containing protein n=1 Tax=Oceanobacillus alkalisoli TaxID=2925113 RepID=UPI001EE3AFEC|nr:LiaF domain-containing protein [Oceanobacillus alkalisoli]MCG5103239.1 cell wall-active antibiotics response protein [Oceanobacillus alkalisoli]